MSTGIKLTAVLATLAAVSFTLVGCDGNTFLISKDQEIEIGREAAAEFDAEHHVDRTSAQARQLQAILDRVARAASPPEYPYSITIVKEDVQNAFALPGGPIYFYEGLLNTLNWDEDQIAWVIGHELTHIRQQHAIRRIERAVGAQVLIEVFLGGQSTAGQIAGVVGSLALQNYGRDNELMADRLGIRWAAGAGYDPTAVLPVLEAFKRIQGSDPSDFELLFLSHPGNNDRENAAKRYLDQQGYRGRYYDGSR